MLEEIGDVGRDGVALGSYDVPRGATHRDIADRLGLSVGTVGEHLQKVESRVFASTRS